MRLRCEIAQGRKKRRIFSGALGVSTGDHEDPSRRDVSKQHGGLDAKETLTCDRARAYRGHRHRKPRHGEHLPRSRQVEKFNSLPRDKGDRRAGLKLR